MEILNFLAMIGTIINDLLSILSALGSLILLLGSFGKASWKRYGQIADWSILGLVFGWVFQIAMEITHTMPERIGIFFPMQPMMVYALLGVSLLMVIGRIVIRNLLRNGK
jgi:hypothetical protein